MADEEGTGAAGAPADENTPLTMLQRARSNDPDAWCKVIRLYRPLVVFWCSRRGVPVSDTDDVIQEVFAAAAFGLAGFRRDRPGDTFRGWLRGIARNQISLYFRRAFNHPGGEGGTDALRQLTEVADPAPEPGEDDSNELGEVYRRACELVRGEFEEQTWRMFWLTVIEGRLPTALAAELGVSPAAIRQAKSRVLRRLKRELGESIE